MSENNKQDVSIHTVWSTIVKIAALHHVDMNLLYLEIPAHLNYKLKANEIRDCPAEDQIECVSWLIVITSDAYTGSWMNLGGARPQI